MRISYFKIICPSIHNFYSSFDSKLIPVSSSDNLKDLYLICYYSLVFNFMNTGTFYSFKQNSFDIEHSIYRFALLWWDLLVSVQLKEYQFTNKLLLILESVEIIDSLLYNLFWNCHECCLYLSKLEQTSIHLKIYLIVNLDFCSAIFNRDSCKTLRNLSKCPIKNEN
jgi:hypothetical protein